jgi:hypothetical protein
MGKSLQKVYKLWWCPKLAEAVEPGYIKTSTFCQPEFFLPSIDPAFFIVRTKHPQTHMRRRGESNFRIEIFANIGHGQKVEFGKLLPELALLTVSKIREHFYTKFDSPRLP